MPNMGKTFELAELAQYGKDIWTWPTCPIWERFMNLPNLPNMGKLFELAELAQYGKDLWTWPTCQIWERVEEITNSLKILKESN